MYSYLKNVFWLPMPNKVELYFSNNIPDIEKVAAVFVYAFNEQGELLMVQKADGNWDIPGGGRESSEMVEQTAIRETLEEAFVTIENISVIAYQKLMVKGDKPTNYKRPYPESYEVFVKATVKENHGFNQNNETVSRQFFVIDDAKREEGVQFENRRVILDKILKLL